MEEEASPTRAGRLRGGGGHIIFEKVPLIVTIRELTYRTKWPIYKIEGKRKEPMTSEWMKAFDRMLGRMQGTGLDTYADDKEAMELIQSYEKAGLTIEEAFHRFTLS